MSTHFEIHPTYSAYSSLLRNTIAKFESSGTYVTKGERNVIKKIELDGVVFNIKKFKTPNAVQSLVYRFLRKSKAKAKKSQSLFVCFVLFFVCLFCFCFFFRLFVCLFVCFFCLFVYFVLFVCFFVLSKESSQLALFFVVFVFLFSFSVVKFVTSNSIKEVC